MSRAAPLPYEAGIHDLPLALPVALILRFLGYPEGRLPPPRVAERLERVLEESRGLAHARGAACRLEVSEAESVGLDPIAADALLVGVVTVGRALESRATERMQRGDIMGSALYDAAGSAATEEAADRLSALLAGASTDEAARSGGAVSCRISPGYGRWHLTWQRALLARLPATSLGIRLTPSLLMEPRKSVSFALWLGATEPPRGGQSGCAHCALETCRYRRRAS